jgi:hypothetical protein
MKVMIVCSQDKFEFNNITSINKSSILFKDKQYQRATTFALNHYDKAINFCKKLEYKKYFCLLVKNNFGYTIWLNKDKIKDQEVLSFKNKQDKHSKQNISQTSYPTKKLRKYRGTSY